MAPKYTFHRTGVGPIRSFVTVDAADTSQEACDAIERILISASPAGRLLDIKQRAKLHPRDLRLAEEIAWVAQRLAHQNGNAEMADLFALTAIERGLDLLHTERHLTAVLEVATRRLKDKEGGSKRAILPEPAELMRKIKEMVVMGHGTVPQVKRKLAGRYAVSVRALNKRLRKIPGTD